MTVFWLALFGLIEFAFRVIIFPFLILFAVLFTDENIFTENMKPYLWTLLDAHLRNW